MNRLRDIGNNIRWQLNVKNISRERFCKKLNYSEIELDKLLEGRLAVFSSDINDIASFFSTDKEDLVEYYPQRDNLHCMGNFSSKENKDKILDLFDMYCNLKEIMEE